ncbi:Retrovirus-related Pol polyprotein from transposon 17.6 [Vitis vinifera]|uniref:Retrovirus-related Pol polyprotein from transposon 17.6 n=1 Tax=Vitis vinifera TaxID=29760 RepID=A0A438I5N9_VITVI|nr:Retrovirus-related Pol polyprotein from transposon 17.6 [Vitis vinifera]
MDSQVVTVDQFAAAMASIQEAITSLDNYIGHSDAVTSPTWSDSSTAYTILLYRVRLRWSYGWDDFDGLPVASLPAKFKMPEIERYTGIGCPRIHLRLYSTVMRAHGLDKAQMIMLFPMSLSGATQRWFASLDVSRRRTWDDLAQEFLRQFAFNTVIDVSRRELEALRHYMVLRRVLLEVYGLILPFRLEREETCYWTETRGRQRHQHRQTEAPQILSDNWTDFWSLLSAITPCAPRAPLAPRPMRQFSQLGMPLSRAFQKLMEGGLLTALAPRPPPQPLPPQFRMDLHCAYHQGPGHDTDRCSSLKHAIQDLIDQGLDDVIHMLRSDDGLPEMIVPDDDYEIVMTHSGRIAQTAPSSYQTIWCIHRDALIRALSQIRVETSTTPEGLIHMMTADRATCIVFSADDLPPEGSDHTRPLYITVVCSGHRVPSVLLDNGSALNVCPLATAIALVLRIPASFNLLLGRPWIHQAGAIPSSLHQKVKFIHDGQVITVQSTRDMISSSEPVLQISHSDDDFFLTGFTFDERHVISTGFGLGRRQHGSSEFVTSIDHETPYGLGFTPSRMMFVIWHDYVGTGGSEIQPRVEEIGVDDSTLGELQHVFHQMQLGDETPDMSASAMILPPSPDRASLFSLCFPDETTDYGVIIEPEDMTDGVVPHDEYHDEMDMLGISQFLDIVQREPFSPLELFGVSVIEIAEEDQTVPAPELSAFVIPTIDMYEGTVGPIEELMDLSIYEYSSVSCDDVSLFAPYSLTSQIFDINDEIAQPDSDDQPRELKIGLPLSTDERNRLIHLLRSYLDVFAWSYEDMPGLDPSIVQHHLPILPHARPVKQKLRRLHPRWSLQGYAIWVEECRSHLSASATALFHDMMHRDVEVYVDDMIVKSRGRADHLAALERFFERIRKFRLRLNPKKCTFGVTSGKLLGHMVSERGIEVDPDKIKAILDMPVPRTEKEIRGFLGRLQYISRFIARLTDICEPIFRLLRKNQPTVWNDDCQLAFERIKEYLLSPPVLVPPMPGRPLLLYLSVSDMALGCMLAQLDDSGKERDIYYLSKRMLEYEMRYVMIERFCLALVWATRRLRHYMTEYSVRLISRLDPLRYLFDRPALAASLPIIESRPIDDDFPDEEFVAMTRLSGWRMYFDGAANHSGYGIGVLLVSPQGDHIPRSVRLTFPNYYPTTNNIVEYEACILGLETALELGITQMDVLGDSNLVLRQVQVTGRPETRS